MSTKGLLAISLLITVYASVPFEAQHCDSRGGCYCNCDWANPKACHVDDGSCCFACCCNSDPDPDPPTPHPGHKETYCPSSSDLTVEYGSVQLHNQGWSITGGGAAATKAAFNLLGGSVEFDFEVTQANTGVNQNIYTISPHGVGSGGFKGDNYCDGAKPAGDKWCVEVDWIESNGNCGGKSTLHDVPGHGTRGCNASGCGSSYHYNGRTSFHMKITYDTNGLWNIYRDGHHIAPSSLNPTPSNSDWSTVAKYYSERGAVIYSSQWAGWVPLSDCGSHGDLKSSHFSVKNLRITGSVLQGPKPRLCSGFLE
jgi:hypothetical protein